MNIQILKKMCFLSVTMMLVMACKKDKTNEIDQLNSDGSSYKIILQTDLNINVSFNFSLNAELKDRSKVWIDLNNNDIREENENIPKFGSDNNYLVNSNTFSIYGKNFSLSISQAITQIDISQNPALKFLDLHYDQLYEIDLSKNSLLENLNLFGNEIRKLDFSKNKSLTSLNIGYNYISNCDVSKNIALTSLDCSENLISNLDVSKNVSLTSLYCYRNNIKGASMTALINSLPVRNTKAKAYVYDEIKDTNYEHVKDSNTLPSSAEIRSANKKNWHLYKFDSMDKTEVEILP